MRSAGRACSVDGCEKPVNSRGYCTGHYARLRKYGHVGTEPLRARRAQADCTIRDERGRKHCYVCEQWLPEGSFTRNKNRPDRLDAMCKECWWSKFIIRRYGVAPGWYEETLARQGGCCAICGIEGQRRLVVDHDHSHCGSDRGCMECVRGLLCGNCNVGLGGLRDDADRLEVAARYLRSFKQRASGLVPDWAG